MDREKVIKGLECCSARQYDIRQCETCPYLAYPGAPACIDLKRDALALLKEQEAEISKISNAYLDLAGKASKQPVVVRCKDCKWRNTNACFCKSKDDVQDDWYCSEAQRKGSNSLDGDGNVKNELIDALDSVTWYNGLAEIIQEWKNDEYFDNYEGRLLSWNMETYDSYDEDTKAQLQVIWMMCVCMFGEYGTSPRWGWVLVENKEAFHKFIDDITETFRECHQNEDDEEE